MSEEDGSRSRLWAVEQVLSGFDSFEEEIEAKREVSASLAARIGVRLSSLAESLDGLFQAGAREPWDLESVLSSAGKASLARGAGELQEWLSLAEYHDDWSDEASEFVVGQFSDFVFQIRSVVRSVGLSEE